MAATITRTPWIDDDGTGTTGTVINNAVKTSLYNEIDTALTLVAQLTGGNVFSGTQAIAGLLNVTGLGSHTFQASGTGPNALYIINSAAGAGNLAAVYVGNDRASTRAQFLCLSSTTTPSGPNLADGATLVSTGIGGLSLWTSDPAGALRFYTGGSSERLRVTPTGEMLVGSLINTFNAAVAIGTDLTAHQGVAIKNLSASNAGNLMVFENSAGAVCGNIVQTGAATVSFGTTSDARLKDDAGRAADLTALRAVVVHDFTWKADGVRDRGVFAQDVADLFPRAILTGTDDRTARGDLARPWMIDYSKLVPDLIVGWQHLDAEVAALRAQLATLKG
jgi:hypothetical protein